MKCKVSFSSVLSELDLIKAEMDCNERLMRVYQIFESNFKIPGIIILKNSYFYHMLSKTKFYQVMSRQYMFDLFSRRSVEFFFDDNYSENYLMLEETTSVIEAAGKALQRDEKNRYEPVIVMAANGEHKLLSVQNLLLAQNEIQKVMFDAINQTNEFKKDVLHIVAHDLRNPLSAITGFANLMLEKDLEAEKTKIYADQINVAATNMNNLINEFLVMAINDSIDFDLHYSVINVSEFTEKILASFKNSFSAKQQKLIFRPSQIDVLVNADRNKITEVLENLVSNAIKYSDYGKKIIVEVLQENDSAIIKVSDEGPGFSEKDKEKVFKKFQKLSEKPTGNETSTGLGLYISKRIMDKHEGKIWLVSDHGKGSTFFVSLPVYYENMVMENKQETLSL